MKLRGWPVKALSEYLLIVVGVLFALALEATWQDFRERVAEQELLGALLLEAETNRSELSRWIAVHEGIDAAAADLIGVLESAEHGQTAQIPDAWLSEITRSPTLEPVRATFDAALNSGRISLIQSASIQRSLAAWDRALADAAEEEADGREFVANELLPYLYSAVDIGPISKAYVEDSQQDEGGSIELLPTRSAVTVSLQIKNLIWRRRFLANTAMSTLRTVDSALSETIEQVRRELGQ